MLYCSKCPPYTAKKGQDYLRTTLTDEKGDKNIDFHHWNKLRTSAVTTEQHKTRRLFVLHKGYNLIFAYHVISNVNQLNIKRFLLSFSKFLARYSLIYVWNTQTNTEIYPRVCVKDVVRWCWRLSWKYMESKVKHVSALFYFSLPLHPEKCTKNNVKMIDKCMNRILYIRCNGCNIFVMYDKPWKTYCTIAWL